MSGKEEGKGFEFCQSMMDKCCNTGSPEENAGKFDFKKCEEMMKQFCATKDGKIDFAACMSKMSQCCKGTNEKSDEKVNS
jgi:hypothetical protein